MSPDEQTIEMAALLAWYREMGVSELVGEAGINWLERGEARPGQHLAPSARARSSQTAAAPVVPAASSRAVAAEFRPSAPISSPPRQFPTAAPDAAVMAARNAARTAATLEELGATLAAFDGCTLKATAKNLCFYRGAAQAPLMLIGEAPGRDEDLEGKPFVGRAGQLLDKMLSAIGCTEADVHITNIVYWRPPGNRTPTPLEAQVCRPFLERQIELVAPRLLVLLGGAAAKHLLDVADGIMRLRGKLHQVEIGSVSVKAIATLHPAYLLRTPAAKRLAWRDLLTIKAQIGA